MTEPATRIDSFDVGLLESVDHTAITLTLIDENDQRHSFTLGSSVAKQMIDLIAACADAASAIARRQRHQKEIDAAERRERERR